MEMGEEGGCIPIAARAVTREEVDYYTCRYTVTTRLIPALRWAAVRAILMFQEL